MEEVLGDISNSLEDFLVINSTRKSPIFTTDWFSGNIAQWNNYKVEFFNRDQYNLIYIDASHVAKDVLMDSVLAWELLKVGGIMLFDDYKWDHYTKTPPMTPEPAIDGFLASYSTMYKILHKGYQMHIMKTADYPVY